MSDVNNTVDVSADIPEVKETEVKHDIPLAIKLGLPVFLVAIVIGGYFGYGLYQSVKSSSDSIISDESFPEINVLADDYIIESTEPLIVDMDALPVEVIDDEAIVKLGASFDGLARNVDEVNLIISHAKDDRLSLNEKINNNNDAIDSINNSLSGIQEEVAKLHALYASLSSLAKKTAVLSLKAKKKVTKRAIRPPFTLLSIDQWGNKNSAVLETSTSGETETSIVNIGDIRAGWRIASINFPACIKAVRLSDGIAANLCRTGD